MKQLFAILIVLLAHTLSAQTSPAMLEETLYHQHQQNIFHGGSQKAGLTHFENSLFVDALWDLLESGSEEALETLRNLNPFHFELNQRLRIAVLKLRHLHQKPNKHLMREIKSALLVPEVDVQLIYLLASYEKMLIMGNSKLYALARAHPNYRDIRKSSSILKSTELASVVSDLFYGSPNLANFQRGNYRGGVKIFMFCRTNRLYPCLMLMRDSHGEIHRTERLELWSNPALAASAGGLPSHVRNGDTPAGVYTIDSVMPFADQQLSFGKFRRLILNFIPASKGEALTKSLLPLSSHRKSWWRPAVVARDVGRNMLRIHGTGKINEDPESTFFPFRRTSGCIAQRENTYNGVTYRDQQDLLDEIMEAMELEPTYENETRIKGILYVMEIDSKDAPVTLEDLIAEGIE